MAISSLKGAITGNFVKGLASQSKVANTTATFSPGRSNAVSLDTSLRTGARNLSAGLQALNVGVTFINLSRDFHEKLIDVVTKLDVLVTKGSKGGVSSQNAGLMQLEFQSLNREFQDIVRKARVQGNDVLDVNALSEILLRGGIDPEKSEELGAALKDINSVSTVSTDGSNVTSSSSLLPTDAFYTAIKRTAGDNVDETGDTKADAGTAFRPVRDKLKSIREQLTKNVKALDDAVEIIGKNISLARAAGFALLDLSSSVKGNEDPEDIAATIRDRVRAGAPGSIDQAGNLQSIIVAGLTLNPNTFTSVKK
jgi:flagellin-like hook-associated protein FlgL